MSDQPILETSRLRLRAFTHADAPHVQTLAGTREVADTTLTIPHPYPDGAAEAWIATHRPAWDAGRGVAYAITARTTGALIGAVSLARNPASGSAELGYWIGVREWGRGYATEASAAVCGYAFTSLGVHRIHAQHLIRNPASGRVLRKLGMRHEGTLHEAVRKWGRIEDLAVYAVLAPEWAARHAHAPKPAQLADRWYSRPVLFVSDVERALRFYIDGLGFKKDWHSGDGLGNVCQVSRSDCEIILCRDAARHDKTRLFIELTADGHRDFRRAVEERGVPHKTTWWGYDTVQVDDPDGNELLFPVPDGGQPTLL